MLEVIVVDLMLLLLLKVDVVGCLVLEVCRWYYLLVLLLV